MDNPFFQIALVAGAIGFLPTQFLRSRRWTLAAGLVGVAVMFAAFMISYTGVIYMDLGGAGIVVMIMSLGYGTLTGAVTRFSIASLPSLPPTARWAIVLVAFVVFSWIGRYIGFGY